MIVAGVLGGVLSWGLSEHNARLTTVDARLTTFDARMNNMAETLARIAEGQARVEGERKAITDRLDRIESNINTLVQLHLNTETR